MTLSEWLHSAVVRLSIAGVESPQLEAQLLAGHLFRTSRTWVVAHPGEEINGLAAEQLLQRREAGEPLAYILGKREFFGRGFLVRRGVLIPRQETEMLIELAPQFISSAHPRVLDIGTGSGCIAITLKLEHPSWDIVGLDVSEIALDVARDNALLLGATVRWRQSDLFEQLPDHAFDLVVTNPPYVEADADLAAEIAEWEPPTALFSPGGTLGFYRRLAHESPKILASGGALLTEIGLGQGPEVTQIFGAAGWIPAGSFPDLSAIERVLAFRPPK